MRARFGQAVRVATGLTLLLLSLEALSSAGWVRWLAGAEIAAAAAFCLPGVWRRGGIALIAVLAVGLAHHAVAGHFPASLLFATLAVLMALVHERT